MRSCRNSAAACRARWLVNSRKARPRLAPMIFTASSVYQITMVGLTPLQLVLVGTTLEVTAFVFEIPTGVVADIYSRRLSVIIGTFLFGLGFLVEGLFPLFWVVLLSQVIWGLGWTFISGAHEAWITRLTDLAPATIISTHPITLPAPVGAAQVNGKRQNAGYVWELGRGAQTVHTKYYLPDEAGFWEASWYERGDGDFSLADTSKGRVGFLICTELWFNHHTRDYGKQGMQILACPRATPRGTAPKWVIGGQAAAVVSGAFCLSSNLGGTTPEGGDYAGVGWIIEPGEGKVLGLTSPEQPFLTLDIDLAEADRAKGTYPRYVLD